jgi:Fanconi-associated nuclease 1
VWIDVLLSAGIPVEVCKVKAIEATAAQMDKVKRARKREDNGWGTVKWESVMEEEEEEEEGEKVGHWERGGKRVRVE